MRIRLVEPRPAGHNVYDFTRLPRLGLPLIGKILVDAGHDVRIYCELLDPIDLQQCLNADLVGISSTTATAPGAYHLADLLQSAGVPVVFGGPHVTFLPDEALGHAAYVVRGEGAATMSELVASLEEGTTLEAIQGLSWRATERRGTSQPEPTALLPAGFRAFADPRLGTHRGARSNDDVALDDPVGLPV